MANKDEVRNYRFNEFCRTHRIGRTKAYKEVKAGRLKTFKVGRLTLISRDAAEAWQKFYERGGAA